jgi:hypothetical protein
MGINEIKEKILGIYPLAYVMEHKDELFGSEYCIIKEPYKGTWRNSQLASGW